MPDKNNQNIHSAAPPVPGSIVNNQSSISQIRRQLGGINREIPYSPDPHSRNKAKSKRSADPPVAEFPDTPIPSCLLSSVFCLLSSTHTPYPTHLASYTLLSFFYFVQIRVTSWFILVLVSPPGGP